MRVGFTGISAFQRGVATANAKTRVAISMAVNDVALEIAAKADDLVPFDLGVLSGSQKIDTSNIANLTATIAYGGPAAPYALIQHEDTEYRHANGRQAKYLEQPARQVGRDLNERIERRMRAAL